MFMILMMKLTTCYQLILLGYDGSAFCVVPTKVIKKNITVKNFQEHVQALANIKSHSNIFSNTHGQDITWYDMLKGKTLLNKQKELEAFQKVKDY